MLTPPERAAEPATSPPKLRLVAVAVTGTCNQNCAFCSRRASARDRTELSPALYASIIEDIRHQGGLETLVITGGEPFMHSQFESILGLSASGPWLLKLNTNGTILNDDVSALLQRYKVSGITVSIDGDVPEVHDLVRRTPDSFAHTTRNVEVLVGAGFEVYVNTNVVPANITRIDQIMLLAHRLGAAGMNISRIYPVGRGRDKIRDCYIPHELFVSVIARCLTMKPFGFHLRFEDQVLRHLLDPRYANLKDIGWCHFGRKTTIGCFAGVNMLHVNPNGDVLACTMLECPVGNIRCDCLARIWTESAMLWRLRNRNLLKGICGRCPEKNICGGCRGRAYALLGDELEEDPFCPRSGKSTADWILS